MINSSIAIQVLPKFERESSDQEMINVIDAVISYIASLDLRYEVGPFETTVEGPYETLIEVIRRSNEICVEQGADQVYTYVKINYAPNKAILTIDEKISKHQQEKYKNK
ncbi:MAG TPA: thiamine-binding protein [Clostridiaceae bacterium]|nr:thiamine-binding protein [Clostridiaceae bacterium]